jgi:hypothetical protein
MREIIEFRINNEYAHLLLKPNEGKRNASNTIIHITKEDLKFEQIRILCKDIRERKNDFFFLYSNIKREYSKEELGQATLLQIKLKTTFEPAGEECGTIYDETEACEICGANRKQIGTLKLKKGSIPKKDIARTIAGEVVVSERFKEIFEQRNLRGIEFLPIEFARGVSGYYQVIVNSELELTTNTIAGVNVFDFSKGSESQEFTLQNGISVKLKQEVYKCSKGHTIGLNLLSEACKQTKDRS